MRLCVKTCTTTLFVLVVGSARLQTYRWLRQAYMAKLITLFTGSGVCDNNCIAPSTYTMIDSKRGQVGQAGNHIPVQGRYIVSSRCSASWQHSSTKHPYVLSGWNEMRTKDHPKFLTTSGRFSDHLSQLSPSSPRTAPSHFTHRLLIRSSSVHPTGVCRPNGASAVH